jgi:hypothetical protein
VIVACVAAAGLISVGAGLLVFRSTKHSSERGTTSAQASLVADGTAANQQWVSAMCTNVLRWKTTIQKDAGGLKLDFGAPGRILDAVAATTRTLNELNKLGLPPAAKTAQVQADTKQLQSEIASRVNTLQHDAGSLASGNFGAIGTILHDLKSDTAVGTQIVDELRHVLSVDLGLSLVETPACQQLVGVSS